jgi:hypothetical protein
MGRQRKTENLSDIRADDALLDAAGGRDGRQTQDVARASGQLGSLLADWADEIDRGTTR